MNYPKKGKVIYLDKTSPAMQIRAKRVAKMGLNKEVIRLHKQWEEHILAGKSDPISIIKKAYEIADKHMATQAEFTVCQKGCSACCHMNVSVNALEANYIGKAYPMLTIDKGDPLVGDYYGKPCPFLKDDVCSIYDHRPFACRMYAVYDHPKYCNAGEFCAHFQSTATANEPFKNMTKNMDQISLDSSGMESKDIREWFK